MPTAAAPKYLETHFKDQLHHASPGMRYGMYLPIWTTRADQEKTIKKRAKKKSSEARDIARVVEAQGMDIAIDRFLAKEPLWSKNDSVTQDGKTWDEITHLNPQDLERMTALAERQQALLETLPPEDHLSIDAKGIAPLVTGMGIDHPLENGFAFLNPHGLPYLPGSGIKGVIRAAANELITGEWGKKHGWDTTFTCHQSKDQEQRTADELLFGQTSEQAQQPESDALAGLLQFWDVIPQIPGSHLMVEIMTPHQGEYYQGKQTPHDSGNPNPIKFLAIPPASHYTFHVSFNRTRAAQLGLTETLGQAWQPLINAAFEHAFEWVGFGAKTSVGYGSMIRDDQAAQQREEQRRAQAEQARKEAKRQSMSAEELCIENFREATEQAKQSHYQPGGQFDLIRNDFIKQVREWTDPDWRLAAAEALDESFSNKWGASKKKKQELNKIVNELKQTS